MFTPVNPLVRSIIAPALVVVGATVLVVYVASCSSGQNPGANQPNAELPQLNKIAKHLPEPPPPPPPPEPEPTATEELNLVQDVVDHGCSTTVVRGLSEQIIAEGNCMRPGTYAQVPKIADVTFGKAVFPYMVEAARDALLDATEHAKGRKLTINSMLRTVAQQYLLYGWYKGGRCGIKLAAKPGKSNHQSGLALDIGQPRSWRKTLGRYGFRWMGKRDRWHFDFIGKKASKKAKARRGLDIKAFQVLWNRNNPDDAIRADGDWGESTEKALRRSPVDGFTYGPQCSQKRTDGDAR